jgi:hypothetical protein
MIIAGVIIAVILLFYDICQSCGNISRVFFIPFIPAVLLMMSFVNILFDMSSALGVLFALAGFRAYIAFSSSVRNYAGFILFTAMYFIAGGNSLLFVVLVLISNYWIHVLYIKYSIYCCCLSGRQRFPGLPGKYSIQRQFGKRISL